MQDNVAGRKKSKAASKQNSTETKARLLDAAESLMREQGYASMDDLFVSLYQQRAETTLKRLEEEFKTDQVLQVLWAQSCDPIDVVLYLEFMALSNHRQAVQDEMVKYAEQFQKI